MSENGSNDPRETVRELAKALSRERSRPCMVFVDPQIDERSLALVHEACKGGGASVDVLLHSPGGCSCCAYKIARELNRRFGEVTAFVPLLAKSAATVIALSAGELVLGELGELGPLDAQFSKKQKADFPVDRSCLENFKALEQLQRYTRDTFNDLVTTVIANSGLCAEDAGRLASEVVGKICLPLYSQIDPAELAESARHLEVGVEYVRRVLRRYRPDLYRQRGEEIIRQLVWGYPSHGFVLDREELAEIGIPARTPTAEEAPLVEAIADKLPELQSTFVIELIDGSEDEAVEEAAAVEPPVEVGRAA